MRIIIAILLLGLSFFSGCTSKEQLKDMLKKNPDILKEAIEANPMEIIEALSEASVKAQSERAEKARKEEQEKLEKSFDEPLKPKIADDELIRGKKGAPIVLVEYSDFQCGYCGKGFRETVRPLLKKYGDNIQFIFKHLPTIGQYSKPAAKYYEAISLQDPKKAIEFHDEIFEDQSGLSRGGEKYLKDLAKKLNVDMKKLEKDVNSDKVAELIESDIEEARKFNFSGTPGFVLNGIPIKGAYPLPYFEDIIEKLKKKGRLDI